MAFFNRILRFKPEETANTDKRAASRYPVGDKFPVKVSVSLIGRDEDGNLLGQSLSKARPWGGRLINLSATGASIGVSQAAMAARGEPSLVQFKLGDDALEIPCTVAHFRCYSNYASCGVAFEFGRGAQQKSLLQLLEPVSIGATLALVDPEKTPQDLAGYQHECYAGLKTTRLSVWRDRQSRAIEQFDFRMNDYGVRWTNGMTELETYASVGGLVDPIRPELAITTALTETQQTEIRWLFCLAVPNLAKAVRADVRDFLSQLVEY